MSATLPDTFISTVDAPPALGVPLDSSRLLIAAESFRGGPAPLRVRSPQDLTRNLERTGVGIPAWDAIDVALREGVPEVWLARIVGPAAGVASVALAGGSGTSLTLKAHEVGDWANGAAGGLKAEVVNGPAGASERVIIVTRQGSPVTEVGRTTAQTTRQGLIDSAKQIGQVFRDGVAVPMIDVVAGADLGLPTVAAPANFAGGVTDSASITTTQVRAALDSVDPNLGPMQVVTPGRNTDASNTTLLGYVQDSDRVALLEQASGLAAGAVLASAATLRALGTGAGGLPRLGGVWSQYLTGSSVVPGASRSVPATVVVAGLIARMQRAEGHPNVAPFQDNGAPRWATGIDHEYTPAEAVSLFNAGVNVWTSFLGLPRNRSFRSLDADGASEWVDLAHTRVDRAVRAEARDVGRRMGSRTITRATLVDFASQLRDRLEPLRKAGALAGDTPDEAYRVDVDTVNDAQSMADHEVNAAVGLRMTEHAEFVNITIAKVPIGQAV